MFIKNDYDFLFYNNYQQTSHIDPFIKYYNISSYARGGTHIGKGYGDVPRSWPPFFQASRRSLAHQFTVNAPLLCPPFSIFRKFLHFQPCFGQNSSSLDPEFSKFSFPRPPFLKENPLPRPYILKPAWHTPTKKKLSAPPPGLLCPLIWLPENK